MILSTTQSTPLLEWPLSFYGSFDDYFADGGIWSEESAGQTIVYGVSEKCVELPTDNDSWRFNNLSKDQYFSIFTALKKEQITVSDDILHAPNLNINVNYLNE